ncbi:hypothetical protein GF319_15760 [Candidatus Bathyarchaeota archaeon]|nr:hypothetical protein [Candidatus Bathyarchaeota archaeon]
MYPKKLSEGSELEADIDPSDIKPAGSLHINGGEHAGDYVLFKYDTPEKRFPHKVVIITLLSFLVIGLYRRYTEKGLTLA